MYLRIHILNRWHVYYTTHCWLQLSLQFVCALEGSSHNACLAGNTARRSYIACIELPAWPHYLQKLMAIERCTHADQNLPLASIIARVRWWKNDQSSKWMPVSQFYSFSCREKNSRMLNHCISHIYTLLTLTNYWGKLNVEERCHCPPLSKHQQSYKHTWLSSLIQTKHLPFIVMSYEPWVCWVLLCSNHDTPTFNLYMYLHPLWRYYADYVVIHANFLLVLEFINIISIYSWEHAHMIVIARVGRSRHWLHPLTISINSDAKWLCAVFQ